MIGIIGAMDKEISGIREKMTEKKEKTISGIKFVSGLLGGKETVTAVCGIGKVFAAMCAQTMILEYSPEIIINTGIAGSLSAELSVMNVAVAENVVQYDMDTSPIGDPKGYISGIGKIFFETDKKATGILKEILKKHGIKTLSGVIASGDRFVASAEVKKSIQQDFGAIACEMEGAAIGQVCYVNECPFAVVKAISDGADGDAGISYSEFALKAALLYVEAAEEFARCYDRG